MTDGITSTTSTTSSTSTVQSAANDSATAAITSDFETFLRMMTAQLENQDPLNPIESTDFAVQLATFSGVEQQVRTNQLLDNLGTQMSLSSMGELASFVGMEARAAIPVTLNGEPIELTLNIDRSADSAELLVRNESNRIVQRIAVDPATSTMQWNGVDAEGTAIPWGEAYTLEVESRKDDKLLSTTGAETYATIVEARITNGQTEVVFDGGQVTNSNNVSALREPQN